MWMQSIPHFLPVLIIIVVPCYYYWRSCDDFVYMDEYELICIHLRHDDNDIMSCHVMSLDIMSCWKFSLTPSILKIAKCRLLHSILRTYISQLQKQSCKNSKYWSNGKLFGVVLIIVLILMTTMDLDIYILRNSLNFRDRAKLTPDSYSQYFN